LSNLCFCITTGAGGGWAPGNYTEDKKTTGSALLETGGFGSEGGGVGGLACYKSRGNTKGFGGFGGGGGGCVAGGGGGGFTGKLILTLIYSGTNTQRSRKNLEWPDAVPLR